MKTIKLTLGFITMFAIGSMVLTSCKKKTEEVPEETTQTEQDNEQTTANDNNLAESIVSDIESMGSQVSENASLSTFKSSSSSGSSALEMSPCATITIANQVATVDFGTSGCLGLDGRTRTGKLMYDFSLSTPTTSVFYRNPGFKVNVSSLNYVVDGNQVNISNKTISNTTATNIPVGVNPGVNLTWSITASVTIIKANNTGTITWSCNRTKELTNTSDSLCYKGQNNPIDWSKAIVKLNGTANGTNAKGESYSVVATNLVRDFNCAPNALVPHRHPFISGTIAYTPGNRYTRLVNYGNGSCDFNATVTINGNLFNIVLP